MNTRSVLYLLARTLGDIRAARRGPRAIIKRQARKVLYKAAARGISKIIK